MARPTEFYHPHIKNYTNFEPTRGGPPAGVSWAPSSTFMVGLLYFFFCDLHKKQNIHTWNSFRPPQGGVA